MTGFFDWAYWDPIIDEIFQQYFPVNIVSSPTSAITQANHQQTNRTLQEREIRAPYPSFVPPKKTGGETLGDEELDEILDEILKK